MATLNPLIRWTPTEGQQTQYIFTAHPPNVFQGGLVTDAATTYTVGGVAHTVVHDSWHEYRVAWRGLRFDMEDPDSASSAQFAVLSSFAAHAESGGEFLFAINSTWRNTTYTLDGDEAKGTTSLTLDHSSLLANDQWLRIERASDPTITYRFQIDNLSGSTFDINEELPSDYKDGDPVSHADAFAKCVLLRRGRAVIVEREGGKGAYTYDFDFTFRTVR